jgi:hypothetical protein
MASWDAKIRGLQTSIELLLLLLFSLKMQVEETNSGHDHRNTCPFGCQDFSKSFYFLKKNSSICP